MIAQAVVDASIAVKWVVQEPGSERARLLSAARLEAPDLLWIECANILWKKVRLGDLRRLDAFECLKLLLEAPVVLAAGRELLEPALRLSLELEHPVYDCLYVALAQRRNVPLITADRKLVLSARRHKRMALAVQLLDEVALG